MRLPLVLSLVPSLVLILSSLLYAAEPTSGPATRPAEAFYLWAVDEMTRIDPETGKAFEEVLRQLIGGLAGDDIAASSVRSVAEQVADPAAACSKGVALQVIIEGADEAGCKTR